MNYLKVFRETASLLLVLSGVLLLVCAWSGVQVWLGDASETPATTSLASAGVVGGILGGLGWLLTRRASGSIGRREALLLVSLSWLWGAALAAAPYYVWAHTIDSVPAAHPFRSFVDCYFESMSGLTTTGATILSDIESLPSGILLWRSLTHWIGGLGIVVLFVAVLPSLGVGGKRLYRVEAPGPSPEGLSPQIRHTARVLWYIYLGLTAAQIAALRIAGMNWFDAVNHAFATMATGGFSTKNASVGAFNSVAVDGVAIVFMFLAGMNFGLFYDLLKGRIRRVWQDAELRFYTALVVGGSAIVVLSLVNRPIVTTAGEELPPDASNALQQGLFTTVSVQTTTGFCTSDFNRWPDVAKAALVALMFIGGCAGSTAGGIKVIRVWMAIKVCVAELERVFRPHVIRPVRISSTVLDDDQKLSVLAFALVFITVFAAGSVTIMTLESGSGECDFASASTASVATLCTIGPGLSRVGAIENYGWFTPASKVVLILLMVIGRLEMFPILILFTPRYWRGN